jgi:2-polyprenyl-6-methoxyphenol hydroxylase-like FAD-dependent oxidoreductase
MTVSETMSVIVIGAGYAGLSAAIELARKGIKVRVFEGIAQLSDQGKITSSPSSFEI